jgi:alpha-glucoside transport system substrate-binding protein
MPAAKGRAMVELPTGTVTFLFTDIEGSTQLVKRLGPDYDEVLEEHQRILRSRFAAYRGREIDTQGDSFFAAFARAGDAIGCAIDAQRALEGHDWPEKERVRVRMGLHSGEPRATGERYVGFGVHRAARIGAVGHGGQILVSNATRELVEDDLPPGTRLLELGAYALKDLDRPERLFQVVAPGLRHEFPPLKARRVGGPHPRRRLALVLASVIAAIAAAAAYWRTTSGSAPIGTTENPITVMTPWYEGDVEHKAFREAVATFEQTTGLAVDVGSTRGNPPDELRERIESGDTPAVAIVGPSVLADHARQGTATPLASLGIDESTLLESYGTAWIDLGTVDSQAYAFPVIATSKSLVWFRPRDLGSMGLRAPRTWEELVSLTKRLARRGETAWAVGAGDWFTLTDWFENIYIRTEGQWKYDALFAGKLPFDDPSVTAAIRRMTSVLRDPYVAGGVYAALVTDFPLAVTEFFGPDPDAHLFMEGGFVGSFALDALRPPPVPGRTIGVVPFPTVDASFGDPVIVGADFVAAFAEDEEVKDFLLYLASPGAGRILVSTGSTVSPNKRIPLSAYPNELVRTAAQQVSRAQVVRFDGSDLLPGTLGGELGLALQGVVRERANTETLMSDFQQEAARQFNQ